MGGGGGGEEIIILTNSQRTMFLTSDTGRQRGTHTHTVGDGETEAEKSYLSLGNSHLESRGRSYSDTSVNSEDSRRRPVV